MNRSGLSTASKFGTEFQLTRVTTRRRFKKLTANAEFVSIGIGITAFANFFFANDITNKYRTAVNLAIVERTTEGRER